MATVDNMQDNTGGDVITMTNGPSADLGSNTAGRGSDSIGGGGCQGDLIRDTLDTCAEQTGLMSNKRETCSQVSVIEALNSDGENTRADGSGVVNVTQDPSITPSRSSTGHPGAMRGHCTNPSHCNDNALPQLQSQAPPSSLLLPESTGSKIDRNVNNKLQMQSVNKNNGSSGSSSTSSQSGCNVEGSPTELGSCRSGAEDKDLVQEGEEGTAVKERCQLGKKLNLCGETPVKHQLHGNTPETTTSPTAHVHVPSYSPAVEAVASCTPLPSNTAGQMLRSGEQTAAEPSLIAEEQFSGKCVNETKERNCDQLAPSSSPAPALPPSNCNSNVKGINEPTVPNSEPIQLPRPSNEENSRDFSPHTLHECHPPTKATGSSGNCGGSSDNRLPFSQESNNNEVNGQLLLEHDHSEGSQSGNTDRTQCSPATTTTTTTSTTETYITNIPTKDSHPQLDVQITQCRDKGRDAGDEGERCGEAGAETVASKAAAFLHQTTTGLSQRGQGQARLRAGHTHSQPAAQGSAEASDPADGPKEEPRGHNINSQMGPQQVNLCDESRQCPTQSVKAVTQV